MSATNIDTHRSSLSDCHWDLCSRFMTRYRHLFQEGQVAALSHFFANTQLLMCGYGDQTRQLVWDLVLPDRPEVKREMGNVEKEVKMELEQESVPTEVTIKKEPEEDEPSDSNITKEPNGVNERSEDVEDVKSPESTQVEPSEKEQQKPKSDATILANLTYFKPARYIERIEDLYRNLVVIDSDFGQTIHEFKRLGLGVLFVTGHELPDRQCRGLVCLREMILAEVRDVTVFQAEEKVKVEFLRIMKDFCYQIVSIKPRLPAFPRLKDPERNIEFYKTIMKQLTEGTTLIFSEEFSFKEFGILKRIANRLGLETCYIRRQSTKLELRVRVRTVPALAILERIVIHQDPELSKLYAVFKPRGLQ